MSFAPIFLANLIFARRFRSVGSSTVAFGANLLGSMLGGTLEYASLVVGYRALLPVVAVLYACAFVFEARQANQARHAAPRLNHDHERADRTPAARAPGVRRGRSRRGRRRDSRNVR